MIFTETKLHGAFIIDVDRKEDNRGFFARAFCQHEFEEHGLRPVIAQANLAFNKRKGTLRGMHFQFPPFAETKIVRATRGAILDIIVDLRPESPTYLEHVAVELSADNHRALYVPERFAHGYQALEDATETSYQVGEFYAPERRGRTVSPRRSPRTYLAAPGHRDLPQGRRVASARGSRGRAHAPDGAFGRGRRRRGGGAVILVDTALRQREAEGRPVQVGIIGAGFMAQGLANQIVNSVPGMRLAGVYGRKLDRAVGVLRVRRAGRHRDRDHAD